MSSVKSFSQRSTSGLMMMRLTAVWDLRILPWQFERAPVVLKIKEPICSLRPGNFQWRKTSMYFRNPAIPDKEINSKSKFYSEK